MQIRPLVTADNRYVNILQSGTYSRLVRVESKFRGFPETLNESFVIAT